MKKAFLLPLLILAFALPSCSNPPSSASTSENSLEVSKLQDLLSKQDLSPVYTKMFTSTFTQDYDVYSCVHGGEEEAAGKEFYTYHGGGMFGCLYEVSEAAYEEVEALESRDFFDYLFRGKGSYAMLQSADLVSYHYEDDSNEPVNSLQSLDFLQNVEARFTDESVQVVNSLWAKEDLEGGFREDDNTYFNGIIDKATLFDAITVRAFSDIFASTNLFDGQRSCETLDRIYFETVEELSSKTEAELTQFVSDNRIHIEDEEDKTLVRFQIGDENLRAILEQNDIIPGIFEGTLTYEKESGKFDEFEYSIVYSTNEMDALTGDVRTVSMEFKATGYSRNQKYDQDLYIDPNPTVYEDAEAFLDDVVKEVVPPVF